MTKLRELLKRLWRWFFALDYERDSMWDLLITVRLLGLIAIIWIIIDGTIKIMKFL